MPQDRDCSAIINTCTSKQKGEHWCGVYKENGLVYFFDSFGRSPAKLTKIFNNRVGGSVIYDDTKVQQDRENNCGQRSIAFLICCSLYGPKLAVLI